jgi:hypothetical protein
LLVAIDASLSQSLPIMRPKTPLRDDARRPWACSGAIGFAGLLMLATPANAVQLVTDAEAALPPGNLAHAPELATRGGPTRRPSIVIVSPAADAGVVRSPLDLRLKLRAFGGAKIDPDSIVVTYEKTPLIDITQRIKPFITSEGIDVPDAEVPLGAHDFRIEVKDSDGRRSTMEFSFQVGK